MGPDRAVVDAIDDIAVAAEGFGVEGFYLVGIVGGVEAGCFDAQVKVAEAQVDVSCAAVFIVFLDRSCAGLCGESDAGERYGFVGFDFHAAEGRAELAVIVSIGFFGFEAAAGEEGGCEEGKAEDARCGQHRRWLSCGCRG